MKLNPFSDKVCYFLNSGAVGDLVACSAVVNYAIKTFHTPRNTDYRVAVMEDLKPLFSHLVPAEKLISIEEGLKLKDFAIRKFNMDRNTAMKNVSVLTASRFHLVQYASIGLLARNLDLKDVPYPALPEVPVSHFGIDFDRAVVFVVTYRDTSRMWPKEEILKTAQAVHDMGLQPVFIGKTGGMANWKNYLAKADFEYPGFGVNLLDKTSLLEMATLMSKSRLVVGMDSGPLHVAMTSNVPVIIGFTNVDPALRIPYRKDAVTLVVNSEPLFCRYCQSDWNLDFWNFNKCPRQMEKPECTTYMTAEKFVKEIKKVTGR